MHGCLVRKYLVQSVQAYVISAKGSLSRSCQTRASLSPSSLLTGNVQYRKRRYPSSVPEKICQSRQSFDNDRIDLNFKSDPFEILNAWKCIKSSIFQNQWHRSTTKRTFEYRRTRYRIGSTPCTTLSTRSFINASNHPSNDNARRDERDRERERMK